MREAETKRNRVRRTLKNQRIAGVGYLVVGAICLLAGLLTESKLDGILFGLAGAGIGPGVLMVWKWAHWSAPERIGAYAQRLDEEQIELRDELKQKLRDRSGRVAYLAGMGVTCVAIFGLAVLSAWREAVPVKAAVLYLCAYLLFQWGVGIWFFKRMLGRYQ